jgi:microcystin-dependent protein
MSEPTTPNTGFIVPLTGDLVGAWATAALNPNFLALDGLFGGVQTIAVSSATTIALTTATGAITPSAGPFQSQNALLNIVGTLTGNIVFQFTQPGRYVVQNKCTVGNFYVQLAPSSGTGNAIGAPPDEKVTVFYDGSSMDYVDLGRVGSDLRLRGATAIPAWIASACTVPPYVLADGSVYSTSLYPALAQQFGSTFGGNGITTFGVPDELNRVPVGIDTGTNGGVRNRLTLAVSGVNGTTMGSAGGNQAMQSHNHGVNDPTHSHGGSVGNTFVSITWGGGSGPTTFPAGVASIAPAATGISIQNTGSGASQNVQPTIVSFLPLIRAA